MVRNPIVLFLKPSTSSNLNTEMNFQFREQKKVALALDLVHIEDAVFAETCISPKLTDKKVSRIDYRHHFIMFTGNWPTSRGFTNGPGDRGSMPGRVIPKTQKMVLDAVLLNTQHYKVRIKSKVEKSRERSSGLSYTSV